jgi:LysM repeat protein
MKIVKIFGLVVAVHAAVFLLIFAIPGCRSSGRKAAESDALGATSAGYPSAAPATAMGATPVSARPAGINATDTAVRPSAGYDSSGVRFSPTRPAAGATATAGAPTLPSAPSLAPAAEAPPAVVYTVVAGDSLWAVAKKHGVSVAEISAVNSLASSAIKPGQTLIIPRAEEITAPAAAPEVAAARATYTVRSGDTLGVIARRHGTSVAALKSANRLTSDIVRIGQELVLPSDSAPAVSAVAAGGAPAAPASAATPSAARSAGGMTHTVAPGETLSEIAKKYGVPYRDIAMANNIGNPRSLKVGQVLKIPGWQAPAGGATKAPAPAAITSAPAPAPAQAVPTLTPRPADNNAPTVNLIIPGANQPQTPAPESAGDVPVIRVEESPPDDGAPRIE